MMMMVRSQELHITLPRVTIYYLQCLLESGRGGSKLLMWRSCALYSPPYCTVLYCTVAEVQGCLRWQEPSLSLPHPVFNWTVTLMSDCHLVVKLCSVIWWGGGRNYRPSSLLTGYVHNSPCTLHSTVSRQYFPTPGHPRVYTAVEDSPHPPTQFPHHWTNTRSFTR